MITHGEKLLGDTRRYVEELAVHRDRVLKDYWCEDVRGFIKANDPGHGYLIVPSSSPHYKKARIILVDSGYGFRLNGAVALEEDCEMGEFLKQISG